MNMSTSAPIITLTPEVMPLGDGTQLIRLKCSMKQARRLLEAKGYNVVEISEASASSENDRLFTMVRVEAQSSAVELWRPRVNEVYCMDALMLCDALEPQSVDCIFADLPYGVTQAAWDIRIPFEPMWKAFKRVIKPRGAIVLTATEPFASMLRMSWLDGYRYDWVWNKNNSAGFALAPYRPFMITEDVLIFSQLSPSYFPIMDVRGTPRNKSGYSTSDAYGITPSKTASKSNEYYPKNILNFGNADQSDKQHPTQKPVALLEYLIRTYTRPGDLVLDPVCGSGTTGIAARQIGRNFIMGDFTPAYVEIARARLAKPWTPDMFEGLEAS